MSFKFVTKQDDMLYNPKRELTSFYQICGVSCGDDYHTVRKVIVDELGNIVSTKEKNYRKKKLNKFIENTNQNKYAIYPTHDIGLINPPNSGDILAAKSSLLNNDNTHSGFSSYN